VKKPEKRQIGEIIGHIGIIRVEQGKKGEGKGGAYLIHASGVKERADGEKGFIERLSL